MKPKRIETLAIIPARSGSKRLPHKNINPILDKPLIAWTVEQAKACSLFDEVIVSTDCQEIADVGLSYGAKVPFMRPESLAGDDSATMDVVHHALEYYQQKGRTFQIVVILEPTSPLRKKDDLTNAMQSFLDNFETYDAMISVGKLEREHPSIIKYITSSNQVASFGGDSDVEAYFPYGVIYAVKVQALKKENSFYQKKSLPYYIERWQNFEIDDHVDFICIENIMSHYREKI